MRNLIDLGVNLDWISPIIFFLQDLANGPSTSFILPRDCGWSGRQVEKYMHRNGVHTWGLLITGDEIMFAVARFHAGIARRLLEEAGLLQVTHVTDRHSLSTRRTCAYCGSAVRNGNCTQCGGPVYD